MTLSITLVHLDAATGALGTRELLHPPEGLAGFKSSRRDLWGAPIVVALGARYLPRLRDGDLWVESADREGFRAECELLLARLPAICAATGHEEEHVGLRLRNFVRAVDLAVQRGAALLID